MLKDTLCKFVYRELIPIELKARLRHKLALDIQRHLDVKAAEDNLRNFDMAEQYDSDSLGYGVHARVMVCAELGVLPRGISIFGSIINPISYRLNDEQKERFLLPTVRGEMNWYSAKTEPDAGGDPAAMRMTAVRPTITMSSIAPS